MAVIARIHGSVRRTNVLRKKDDGSVFASTLNVLTEPDGDPAEVMAWVDSFKPADVAALQGAEVVLLVEAATGRYGLQFVLVEIIEADALVSA